MSNPRFCSFLFETATTNASRHQNNTGQPKTEMPSKPFCKKFSHTFSLYLIENLFQDISIVENTLQFLPPLV